MYHVTDIICGINVKNLTRYIFICTLNVEMRKLIIISLIAFVLAMFKVSFISAQAPIRYYDWSSTLKTDSTQVLGVTAPAASPKDYVRFDKYLIGKKLSPNSPFYFVKRLQENIQFALTFDNKAKEEMRLELAGQRLSEMQTMADLSDVKSITTAAKNYQSIMEEVAKNIGDSIANVDTETSKHTVILHEVLVKVPSQGEKVVQQALEASEKSADNVADLTDRPAIPSGLVDRITSLKAQGLLTPEETAKLTALKTRTEARQELKRYVNEGILPTADLLRMDDQMKVAFPNEFYRIHEVKRFMEMKKLESQKPDPAVQIKIQEFAKNYKPGDIIPSDIRAFWIPIVRLEEVQNTIRPDLIDPAIFKNNPEDEKKFKEIVERYKPRQEDLDFVNKYLTQNKTNIDQLSPEYQRMYRLGQTYGTQTAAIPSANKPSAETACPSNAHYVSYNGGYCIPNYTPRIDDQKNYGYQDTPCLGGYHRSYAGGACIQDNNQSNVNYLPSLTTTPGNYPSPFYSLPECGPNFHRVSEPINPRGWYCAPDSYQQSTPSSNASPSRENQEAACKASGGVCISWVNNACGCERPNNSSTGECRMPQNGCGGNGRWWDLSSCVCREAGSYPSACAYPSGGCQSGKYWDSASCTCRSTDESPKPTSGYTPPPANINREVQETNCRNGGGTCNWNRDTCQCSPNYTPPAGYGPCSQGQYWNGSICANHQESSSPSRESQEAACKSGGGTCVSWVNGACGCERPNSGSTSSTSSENPEEACRRGGGCTWTGSACNCPALY